MRESSVHSLNTFLLETKLAILLHSYLLPVFFTLNGIHSRARASFNADLKLCILAESTGVTEKWIFLIVINSSAQGRNYIEYGIHRNLQSAVLPHLVAT